MGAMVKEAEMRGEDINGLNDKIKRPHINMFSALIHVSADLFRSTSTFILAVIICSTIFVAGGTALWEWFTTSYSWYTGLGQAIEVECPEGIEPGDIIRIEPSKAGQGKAADAFMG